MKFLLQCFIFSSSDMLTINQKTLFFHALFCFLEIDFEVSVKMIGSSTFCSNVWVDWAGEWLYIFTLILTNFPQWLFNCHDELYTWIHRRMKQISFDVTVVYLREFRGRSFYAHFMAKQEYRPRNRNPLDIEPLGRETPCEQDYRQV